MWVKTRSSQHESKNAWYVRFRTELNKYFAKSLCSECAYIGSGGDWVDHSVRVQKVFVGTIAFWEMEFDADSGIDVTQKT